MLHTNNDLAKEAKVTAVTVRRERAPGGAIAHLGAKIGNIVIYENQDYQAALAILAQRKRAWRQPRLASAAMSFKERQALARRMVRSGDALEAIRLALGYSDISSVSRLIRKR
jgi:hypothetical protein